MKVSKKAKIRNRYNQLPHLAQGITRESDKNTRKLHIHASQEVSPLRTGDHKAAMNRQVSMTNTKLNINNKNDPQKSTAFERSVKTFFTGGLELVSQYHHRP